MRIDIQIDLHNLTLNLYVCMSSLSRKMQRPYGLRTKLWNIVCFFWQRLYNACIRDRITISQCFFQLKLVKIAQTPLSPSAILTEKTWACGDKKAVARNKLWPDCEVNFSFVNHHQNIYKGCLCKLSLINNWQNINCSLKLWLWFYVFPILTRRYPPPPPY